MNKALTRLIKDVSESWTAMPKRQALRWYGALLVNIGTVVKTRKLYSADGAMTGRVTFNLRGTQFDYDLDAFAAAHDRNPYSFLREMYVRKIYLRAFGPLSFKTCLDVGCNQGMVAWTLRQMAGAGGRVVAVDCQDFSGCVFRHSADVSAIEFRRQMVCGESLIADKDRLARVCAEMNALPAEAMTISQFMTANGLGHIDFLKMDIEGAEFEIFKGNSAWLDRVDNLAMEVHRTIDDPTIILEILERKGFAAYYCGDFGEATTPQDAGYIYGSKTGSLRMTKELPTGPAIRVVH